MDLKRMHDSKVLYEKHYPELVFEEEEPAPDRTEPSKDSGLSFEAFMKKLESKSVWVPIPNSGEKVRTFIGAAKEAADFHQIDLTIIEQIDRITAEFSFEVPVNGVGLSRLISAISLADDITFPRYQDGRLLMSLELYTKELFYNGHRVIPYR